MALKMKDSKKTQTFGEISKEEFQELKKKHGTVHTLRGMFETEKGELIELVGYIRKPKRFEMDMPLSMVDRSPVKAREIILEKGWLTGDERLKTEDDAFFSIYQPLGEFFLAMPGSIKKN